MRRTLCATAAILATLAAWQAAAAETRAPEIAAPVATLAQILERRAGGDLSLVDLQRLADQGEAQASLLYGLALLGGEAGAVTDETARSAAAYLRVAAEAAEPQAQFVLGLVYERGKGVARDPAEAARWYRFAAQAGDAEAMFRLGALHDSGEGARLDPIRAAELYRQSAEAGFAPAMVSLAAMYETGQGVEQDRLAALGWYEKAAASDRFAARRAATLRAQMGMMFRPQRRPPSSTSKQDRRAPGFRSGQP
jgi:hypothetical protein